MATIIGTSNADSLAGTADNDILSGLDGNDTLIGGGGNDSLTGGSGNDFLSGDSGLDVLIGGAGDDTYVIDIAGDLVDESTVHGGSGIDTVMSGIDYTLGVGLENLALTGNALHATGNSVNNVIHGNGGDNRLDGGAGSDTLIGGKGNDTYVIDRDTDKVDESNGGGVDTILSEVDFTLGKDIEHLVLTDNTKTGIGNDINNLIVGNASANLIDGGMGADIMVGGAGNDTYLVDSTGDQVLEVDTEVLGMKIVAGGTDTVKSAVNFTLGAGIENLTLVTGAKDAPSIGIGNDLNNTLIGNDIANLLDGGVGADTLKGGLGDDTYIVDSKDDKVDEGSGAGGIDTVKSAIDYTLGSGLENLTLINSAINGIGNGQANVLAGNNLGNLLDGGQGADTLSGGAGNDTYVVDNAADKIIEESGAGIDTVRTSLTNYTLSTNLENLVLISSGAGNAIGNAANNVITGNASANLLNGGAGADTLIGGAGNDTYIVDSAKDVIDEGKGSGTDTVISGFGYTLGEAIENLTLSGSAIYGTGNLLNNSLTGNDVANKLDGGAGADTLAGGAGDDSYVVDSAKDVVKEVKAAGTDTVYTTLSYELPDEVEHLFFDGVPKGDVAVVLTGNVLANRITGSTSADILEGGGGIDTLVGGSGNDTYYVDNEKDVIVEADIKTGGDKADLVFSEASYTLSANVENLILIGNKVGNIQGNMLDNALVGNFSANLINGGAGADTMAGGSGNDTYVVDNSFDRVIESSYQIGGIKVSGSGTDTVQSLVSFSLDVGIENLILVEGGSLNIEGIGNSLNNVITGNALANRLEGGTGSDTLIGGAGNDTYVVDSTSDKVNESNGGGVDMVLSAVSFTLGDGLENLVLTGASPTTTYNGIGNALDNVITGTAGKNLLAGGGGVDILTGGKGADTFDFNAVTDSGIGEKRDIIKDFSVTEGDRIDLSGLDANAALSSNQSFTYIGSNVFTAAGQARFDNGVLQVNVDTNMAADFEIQLTGVTTLAAANLML